jgi:hypothetical protein
VRERGLEPPRDRSHRDLNPARLPIPPHPHAWHLSHETLRRVSILKETLCGGSPGIRTQNLRVKSPLRCQLRQRPEDRTGYSDVRGSPNLRRRASSRPRLVSVRWWVNTLWVGLVGFEPTTSTSQTSRANQAAPQPEDSDGNARPVCGEPGRIRSSLRSSSKKYPAEV